MMKYSRTLFSPSDISLILWFIIPREIPPTTVSMFIFIHNIRNDSEIFTKIVTLSMLPKLSVFHPSIDFLNLCAGSTLKETHWI